MLKKAVSECWENIMIAFLKFGFLEEEIKFEIDIKEKGKEAMVRFHPKLHNILKKHYFITPMPPIFESHKNRIKFVGSEVIIINMSHGLGLAMIQFLLFVAMENMEKGKN